MFGKILVLELLPKMLSANQIAGFFKLEYLLNYMRYQHDFLYIDKYPLKLQTDHGIIVCKFMRSFEGVTRLPGYAQSVPNEH